MDDMNAFSIFIFFQTNNNHKIMNHKFKELIIMRFKDLQVCGFVTFTNS